MLQKYLIEKIFDWVVDKSKKKEKIAIEVTVAEMMNLSVSDRQKERRAKSPKDQRSMQSLKKQC